ncbi:LRFN5 [Branchiostoma lanceolatum]|uniref:LRFN5 protein n=1 Tax=Branchiostoma lanceolatum TaxID=7740 RepID=A0A8K0AES4_BRALA|nr:LRFN5 [Branchiostoma lanceolatum]
MADPKLSLFLLFLLAFDPSQAGQSCLGLCEIKRTEYCRNRGGISINTEGSNLPCATCNTTGQTDENQLGCLPATLKKLQVAGHSDRNGNLKTLPRLSELRTLILGPGSIHTVGRGAFESVPNVLALSMGKNAIKAIGSWFGGFGNLEKLALSWNEIEEIKENALQPLVRLEYLDLRHNQLRAVEEWHFASLTNLMYLHLSYNNISHIAGRSFNRLSRLDTLNLDQNKLWSPSTEWLQGLSATSVCLNDNLISTITSAILATLVRRRVYLQGNPFHCTCALVSFGSMGSYVRDREELQCSYPPSLSGRKITDVPRGEMPCPSPTVKISRQDHGATLVCEVFWEKQPEIRWLDPGGRAVGERESLDPCGGAVTTRHEFPTTQSPKRGTTHSPDDPGLPYIGKSTSTLRMSQQAYRCWTEGSFRCDVRSAAGNVFADLPLTKSSLESQQDQRQEHTVMPAAFTTTPARRNARMTERIAKATDKNSRQDGTTPAADKAQRQTVMAAGSTSKPNRQNRRMTESISKTTDKNAQQVGTTPAAETEQSWQIVMMIFMGIIAAVVAMLVLERAVAKCHKKLRPQRHGLQGNAAGAIGGIPLQIIQPPAAAPTAGNPLPPNLAYDDIPDDTPITPYAETSRLENPVYGADVTGPGGATSIPGRRPRSNRPPNSRASSQPQGSGTTRPRNAPVPPPRPNRPADFSDSNYYPPSTETTQAAKIPDPLPRTNRYVNSSVSSQAQGVEMPQARRIPDPLPRTNRYVNSNVSSQARGLEMPRARRIPDPLPRTHTYVNSNVSSQAQGRRMATLPRRLPSSVPRGLGMDDEEEVEGPNIYFDLNGPPRARLSGSRMRRAEDAPDSLLRTNRYSNSNVSSQAQGLEMPQTRKIPDPLPRTHAYVNSNVSSQPRGSEMPKQMPPPGASSHHQEEEVEGPNIYLDLNGPGRPVT